MTRVTSLMYSITCSLRDDYTPVAWPVASGPPSPWPLCGWLLPSRPFYIGAPFERSVAGDQPCWARQRDQAETSTDNPWTTTPPMLPRLMSVDLATKKILQETQEGFHFVVFLLVEGCKCTLALCSLPLPFCYSAGRCLWKAGAKNSPAGQEEVLLEACHRCRQAALALCPHLRQKTHDAVAWPVLSLCRQAHRRWPQAATAYRELLA